jgi:ubiquinone/menaquinone biosynthesis C-methylase UbiE
MNTNEDIELRIARERDSYNQGFTREKFDQMMVHSAAQSEEKILSIIKTELSSRNGGRYLELGAYGWIGWIEEVGVQPGELVCINISEKEMERGMEAAATSRVKPLFQIMDAHKLEFPDNSFDVVFGAGSLHHLDYEKALHEIHRVLKPGGLILFHEPLGGNPVARIVRLVTPSMRTIDERPVERRDLKLIRSLFRTRFYFDQLFSVPIGVVSALFSLSPRNFLTRLAFGIDKNLQRALPALGPIYRHVLIVGDKQV